MSAGYGSFIVAKLGGTLQVVGHDAGTLGGWDVTTGMRLFAFKADGTLDPKPVATHKKLSPDTHTPVVAGDRLFGVWSRLYCLSLKDGLKEVYEESGPAFSRYCAAVATDTRVLVVPRTGELVLLDATAKVYTELGRLAVFGKDEKGVYAHPAFVGTRVYVRGSGSVVCVELGG